MRYGLAAWGLRETPLEEQLALAKDLGVDLLELSIANHPNDPLQLESGNEDIARVIAAFEKYGIALECGCTGNDFTCGDTASGIANLKKVIAIAGKLKLKTLRIFAGFTSDSLVYGNVFSDMLDALAEVNAAASDVGVTLCVETHGGVTALDNGALLHFNSVSTRSDCWKEILKTGVSMTFDPANLTAVGINAPEAFYLQFKEAVHYVHLKDFKDVPGGIVPAACGEGRINWKTLLEAMKDCDLPAMIEYEIPADVKVGMKRSLDFLRKNA